VKPSPGAGSVLVKLCRNAEEVQGHIKESEDMLKGSKKSSIGMPASMLIEEYIEGGQEVDIDCVIKDGRIIFAGVSDNYESYSEPYFLERGGEAPSALS
jgi:biotin carboxylase